MVTGWKAYLSVSENAAHRCAGGESLRRAYRPLREAIRNVVEAARPKTVACLGAGVLNDIPYRALVQSDATLHLVDWMPDLIETGIPMASSAPTPTIGPSASIAGSTTTGRGPIARNSNALRRRPTYAAISRAGRRARSCVRPSREGPSPKSTARTRPPAMPAPSPPRSPMNCPGPLRGSRPSASPTRSADPSGGGGARSTSPIIPSIW